MVGVGNVVLSTIFLVLSFAAMSGIPNALARFSREREDVFLLGFSAALCLCLSIVFSLVAISLLGKRQAVWCRGRWLNGIVWFWLAVLGAATIGGFWVRDLSTLELRLLAIPFVALALSWYVARRSLKGTRV